MKLVTSVRVILLSLNFCILSLAFIQPAKLYAATSPGLGTATSFSILAGSTITNIPTSSIAQDVGLSPAAGSFIVALTDAEVAGTIYAVDGTGPAGSVNNPGIIGTALADAATAYSALGSQTCDITYAGTKDLVGENLIPGVYCANAFALTGTLTLTGAAEDVWIFKSASSLVITGSTANIVFVGGGQACNVWWRVVSSASFTADTEFAGNILADTSITFAAGVTLEGRALARTAAVTLSSTTITEPICLAPTATPTTTPTATTPGLPNTGTGFDALSNKMVAEWGIPVGIVLVASIAYLISTKSETVTSL